MPRKKYRMKITNREAADSILKDAIKIILKDADLIEHSPDLSPDHIEALARFVGW